MNKNTEVMTFHRIRASLPRQKPVDFDCGILGKKNQLHDTLSAHEASNTKWINITLNSASMIASSSNDSTDTVTRTESWKRAKSLITNKS